MQTFVAKLILYLLSSLLLVTLASGIDFELDYSGFAIKNVSDGSLLNKTHIITSYLYIEDQTCSGTADETESTSVNITDGNFKVPFNFTADNRTFFIKPSIAGQTVNETCFKYTVAAQCQLSDNTNMIGGVTSSNIILSGEVTGVTGASVVDNINLTSIDYVGEIGFSNITKCANNEIMKMTAGGLWNCENDDTGSFTDTNESVRFQNLVTDDCPAGQKMIGANATGGVVCTVDLDSNITDTNESGRFENLTATNCPGGQLMLGVNATGGVICANDVSGSGGNSTNEIIAAVNVSGYNFLFTASNLSGSIFESQISNLTHTTDTNESNRMNNLTNFNCAGTDKMVGVNSTGGVECEADVDTSGGNSTLEIIAAVNVSGYNFLFTASNLSGSIFESQISNLTHTTDTNESGRFDNLTGNDCPSTDKMTGVNATGGIICGTDLNSGAATNIFNQSLNTTDDVVFGKVNTSGEFRSKGTFRTGVSGEPGRWRFYDATGFLMSFWVEGTDFDTWGLNWDTSINVMDFMGNNIHAFSIDLDDGNVDAAGTVEAEEYTEGGSATLTNSITGNSATATALAANGGNCAAGSFPLGVDASGAVESCTTTVSSVNGTGLNGTLFESVQCSNIIFDTGKGSASICDGVDNSTGGAGGGNSTDEIRTAVNASVGYLFSASNLSGSIGADQVTTGSFPSGDYVFPRNVTAIVYLIGTSPQNNTLGVNASDCTFLTGPTSRLNLC